MSFPQIQVDSSRSTPVYRQIANEIRRLQQEGALSVGAKLPPTREFASRLGVNRNTVIAAYDALQTAGVVESRTGKGTFLTTVGRDLPAGTLPEYSRAVEGASSADLAGVYRLVLDPSGISFAGSYPDDELLPAEDFAHALDSVLREEGSAILGYASTAGDTRLRRWIADSMNRQGGHVDPEQILITHGAQQGIDLVFRAFVDRGDPVLVETPTYTGAIGVLRALGARAIGVPVGIDGIRLDALETALERYRPRLLYLQPTFQNPTGAVLPVEGRGRVLALASRYGCRVLEDDWGSDLAFDGVVQPGLHVLDRENRTIYLGSFSKRLLPGLRVGWLMAGRETIGKILLLKQLQDFGNSPLIQAGLRRFLESGLLEPHLVRVRAAYRSRRDAMTAALAKYFPTGTRWTEPQGGLFLWVELPETVAASELFQKAREHGVSFSRGKLFHPDGSGAHAMRLAFGAHTPKRIEEGIRILGEQATRLAARATQGPAAERRESVPIL